MHDRLALLADGQVRYDGRRGRTRARLKGREVAAVRCGLALARGPRLRAGRPTTIDGANWKLEWSGRTVVGLHSAPPPLRLRPALDRLDRLADTLRDRGPESE